MNDERWAQITTLIKDKFEIEDQGIEELDPGQSEYFIFEGPLGRMRLERTTRPKLKDRKVHGSTRIGGTSHEERIYSDDETVSFFKAYRWDEDQQDWLEIDIDKMLS